MSETKGLLEIEPLELKLPYKLHSNVVTTVRVINKTNEYIAFKVLQLLKVGPNEYSFGPNHGLMKPSSHFDMLLRLYPKTETAPDIDQLRVSSVIVTENTIVNSIKDVNDIMNVPGKMAVEAVIPVAYVQNQSDQASTNSNTIAELVQIEPLELKFPYELHRNVVSTVRVINKTNEYIAFRVLELLKVGPKDYSFSPNHGLMKPSSQINIVVKLYPKTEAAPGIDQLRVWSVIVTENAIVNSIKDVRDIMNVPGKIAIMADIPIAYVQNQSDQARTINKERNGSGKVHEVTSPVAYVQQALVKGTAKRSISTIEEEEEEEGGGGEKGEENEENEMEALSSQDVQKMKKELAKVRKELEKNKKLVKEFQQKLGYIQFEFEELEQLTDDFADSCKIGKGGFSVVYKGSYNDQQVAIKKLKINDEKGFEEEIDTLSKVRHPNIITLIGACNDKVNRVLIYEYLPNGSLEDHLNCKNGTPRLVGHARIRIALEICCALSFLHSIPRAHGDLKPDNVLLDSNFVSKLSDFGTCRKLEHTNDTMTPSYNTVVKGTGPYMDPDFSSSGDMTPWFDVYSFGVVLLRLATGKDVYNAATKMTLKDSVEIAIEDKNFDKLVDVEWPSKEAPEKMAKLGLQCFERRWGNPRRPNAAELFNLLMDVASNK